MNNIQDKPVINKITTNIDSCGLQQIDLTTKNGKLILKKLKIMAYEKYAKDAVRECQCGELEIYYAWTLDYVKKYCNSCGAFQLKRSKIKL